MKFLVSREIFALFCVLWRLAVSDAADGWSGLCFCTWTKRMFNLYTLWHCTHSHTQQLNVFGPILVVNIPPLRPSSCSTHPPRRTQRNSFLCSCASVCRHSMAGTVLEWEGCIYIFLFFIWWRLANLAFQWNNQYGISRTHWLLQCAHDWR